MGKEEHRDQHAAPSHRSAEFAFCAACLFLDSLAPELPLHGTALPFPGATSSGVSEKAPPPSPPLLHNPTQVALAQCLPCGPSLPGTMLGPEDIPGARPALWADPRDGNHHTVRGDGGRCQLEGIRVLTVGTGVPTIPRFRNIFTGRVG